MKPSAPPGNVPNRQLRFAWWALLFWLSVGFGLEVLHGFKVSWYLDANQTTRRLMFTLAHAHGTLLALVNIAAVLTERSVKTFAPIPAASRALIGSALLIPGGFFLGGLVIHDGDPGLGIVLVPVGAVLLIFGVGRFAVGLAKAS